MSWVVWITGPPASGKSALAHAAAERLRAGGIAVEVLELDDMRRLLTPQPTSSDIERDAAHRALVAAALTLTAAGVPVIIDAAGQRREWRDLARATVPQFAEVLVERAGAPGTTAPGEADPYEPPLAPELRVDPTAEPLAAAAGRIAALAAGFEAATPPAPRAGWAIWITGLPGSGKTTIASGAAERLAGHGILVRVLDVAELREAVRGGATAAPGQEELVHRALVYIAKRLTDAGVPVIVDATAPRRSWRQLARERIARFAEVQLVCPAETCATRERAVRWHLRGCPQARPTTARAAPDIVLDYEPPLAPELTIYTHVEDEWTAADTVAVLARRLHSEAAPRVAEGPWAPSRR